MLPWPCGTTTLFVSICHGTCRPCCSQPLVQPTSATACKQRAHVSAFMRHGYSRLMEHTTTCRRRMMMIYDGSCTTRGCDGIHVVLLTGGDHGGSTFTGAPWPLVCFTRAPIDSLLHGSAQMAHADARAPCANLHSSPFILLLRVASCEFRDLPYVLARTEQDTYP